MPLIKKGIMDKIAKKYLLICLGAAAIATICATVVYFIVARLGE